ncbi:MAG: hypothetical protein IKF14_15880 [Atopobiaceae bacterium]|nr:hypothetical protein [Atopobiaceae bacterium]
MGLIARLFGKRHGQQLDNPATEVPEPAVTKPSTSTKERSKNPNPPTPPAEPEYTQEELFEKLRNEYSFGIREGEKYVPQFDDLDMLYELKNFARHPRVKYLAGERYKEVLAERLAKAAAQVAEISSQAELAALAEDETADKVLRETAAKAVTDQDILKRWAIEKESLSFFSMPERITDPATLADIAREASDPRTQTAVTELIRDEAVLEDMARNGWGDQKLAIKRLNGYACTACGEVVLPEGDAIVPCTCPACGAENHDWKRVNNVREYRDYEVGEWHDECTRCGATAHHHSVNTL